MVVLPTGRPRDGGDDASRYRAEKPVSRIIPFPEVFPIPQVLEIHAVLVIQVGEEVLIFRGPVVGGQLIVVHDLPKQFMQRRILWLVVMKSDEVVQVFLLLIAKVVRFEGLSHRAVLRTMEPVNLLSEGDPRTHGI